MTGKKIMLGMLTLGSLNIRMASFLYSLLKDTCHDITIVHTERVDVSNGRNDILFKFKNSDCEYLLFLDDDNPPEDLWFLDEMLSHDKDIVSALVPSRKPDDKGFHRLCIFREAVNPKTGIPRYEQYCNVPKEKLTEIANCWMGCVLISKRVVEDIFKEYNTPCQLWEFWYYKSGDKFLREDDVDMYKLQGWQLRFKRYISEDLLFFERARWFGYKIWADNEVWCYHIGESKLITVNEHIIAKNYNLWFQS